jgi:2-phospho-L-lactate guanylyltransferase (CobY/MobA/RfbA family)
MHITIVPIKSLLNSKKRLESFLSPAERRELVISLLKDVLFAASHSKLSDGTLLVSPDKTIIEMVQKWDLPKLSFLLEPDEWGINQAVQFASYYD